VVRGAVASERDRPLAVDVLEVFPNSGIIVKTVFCFDVEDVAFGRVTVRP
jgi:hypothetical protein